VDPPSVPPELEELPLEEPEEPPLEEPEELPLEPEEEPDELPVPEELPLEEPEELPLEPEEEPDELPVPEELPLEEPEELPLEPEEEPDELPVPEELPLVEELEVPEEPLEPDELPAPEALPLLPDALLPDEVLPDEVLPDPEELVVPVEPPPEEVEPHAVRPSEVQTNPHRMLRRIITSLGTRPNPAVARSLGFGSLFRVQDPTRSAAGPSRMACRPGRSLRYTQPAGSTAPMAKSVHLPLVPVDAASPDTAAFPVLEPAPARPLDPYRTLPATATESPPKAYVPLTPREWKVRRTVPWLPACLFGGAAFVLAQFWLLVVAAAWVWGAAVVLALRRRRLNRRLSALTRQIQAHDRDPAMRAVDALLRDARGDPGIHSAALFYASVLRARENDVAGALALLQVVHDAEWVDRKWLALVLQWLAYLHALGGDLAQARRWIADARARLPAWTMSRLPYVQAIVALREGLPEDAVALLEADMKKADTQIGNVLHAFARDAAGRPFPMADVRARLVTIRTADRSGMALWEGWPAFADFLARSGWAAIVSEPGGPVPSYDSGIERRAG
jgi:hypothetical protein